MIDTLDSYVWVPETNSFLSERVRRVAEIINDYDAGLFLAPTPDEIRAKNPGKTFAIIHENEQGYSYVVRLLEETEIDENLLVWLWTHDNNNVNVLERIEKLDEARKAIKLKAIMEEREENQDIGKSILNSPLHTYRHNGKIYR